MNGIGSRPALLAVIAAALAVAGCSSSGAGGSAAAASPGSPAASSGAAAAGSSTGTPAGPARPSSTAGAAGSSSAPATRRSTTALARPSIPTVKATAVGGVGYTAAPADVRSRFARIPKASGGLVSSSSVRGLTVGGREVGGVGVYSVEPGPAKSVTFQRQYVVQLVDALAGSTAAPRFVQADRQVLATSTGGAAVAGWFEGGKVVLVYRSGSSPDLTALALGVRKAGLPG
jgi:hypothetical protein